MTGAQIVLLSDFGASHYAGQLGGAVLSVSPDARLAVLTHAISPHNITEAAIVLADSVSAFPMGSVFLCVVDPGVGTPRRGVAVEAGGRIFVGPDNGLFSLVISGGSFRAVELANARFFRATISPTFHGRDIFAPVAAHVSLGAALEELGPPITDLVTLDLPKPAVVSDRRIDAHALYADSFGNIVTDVNHSMVEGEWQVLVRGRRVRGIDRTYGDGSPGRLMALAGSSGRIELAVRGGSAVDRLHVRNLKKLRMRFIRKR
ncbi:MAG: SAM-dependent chlorinase/fluorinase [Myxococcota bacterium]|jgi:hypothetical protein